MKNTRTICIPFAGFYETYHDLLLDDEQESFFSDDSGALTYYSLHEKFTKVCDYGHAFREYSKLYTQGFSDNFGIKTLRYESLDSPGEYNFTTDRIFCTIEDYEVLKMYTDCCPDKLANCAILRHTSRSGFSSFYNPDYKTWDDVLAWDHNQLETLLVAWTSNRDFNNQGADNYWSHDDEIGLMQSYKDNGYITGLMLENKESLRLVNIADYLRQRAERK